MSFLNTYLGRNDKNGRKDALVVGLRSSADSGRQAKRDTDERRRLLDRIGWSPSEYANLADEVNLLDPPRHNMTPEDAAASLLHSGLLHYRPAGVILVGKTVDRAIRRVYDNLYGNSQNRSYARHTHSIPHTSSGRRAWRSIEYTAIVRKNTTDIVLDRALRFAASRGCLVVGLCGGAGTGKDTLANAVCSGRPAGIGASWAARVSLADAVKRALTCALVADGYNDAILWGQSASRRLRLTGCSVYADPSGRTALQALGTELGRNVLGGDIWIRKALASCDDTMAIHGPGGVIVIPDVRFRNEADAVHAVGGIVVAVLRDSADKHIAGIPGHASEAEIPFDAADTKIDNNGAIAGVRKKMQTLIRSHMSKLATG